MGVAKANASNAAQGWRAPADRVVNQLIDSVAMTSKPGRPEAKDLSVDRSGPPCYPTTNSHRRK